MEKSEINEIFRKMYVMNESFDEESFKEEHPNWYEGILEVYGEWNKALRSNGINQKKLRERKKFFEYCLMMRRYYKDGEESLRPKNIDDQIKERISDLFPTMKKLLECAREWNKDKVMYEMRKKRICGKDLEDVEKENPVLYKELFENYGNEEQFEKEYENRYGIAKLKKGQRQNELPISTLEALSGKRVIETEQTPVDAESFIEMIISLGYISEEEVETVLAVQKIQKEDIYQFVYKIAAKYQKMHMAITDELVKREDASMYYAIQAEYGSVEDAVQEAFRQITAV